MKTLGIVIPKFNNEIQTRYSFPVGLAYIQGALKAAGYNVKAINLNYVDANSLKNELSKWLIKNRIDICLSGGLSRDFHRVREVFDVAKRCNPEIITIGGGGGFSSEPLLFSEMCMVDYACIGEGEITICELVKVILANQSVKDVKGVVWHNDAGQYVYNGDRAYIDDLDSIAFPDYENMDLERYLSEQTPYDDYSKYSEDDPRQLPIFLGRSCPFQCNFCYHPLGNKYRQRSLDNFFEELDSLLKKYKINSLGIFDELFSLQKDKIYEFCKRIKEYKLSWNIQLRVNIVDKKLLDTMKDAGCKSISYGIESFNKDVLKNMNKHITPEEIERALELTYNAGICIQGNFIFGDEEETMETFSETLSWWREHRKYNLNLIFIETYPGTQIYKNSVARGLINDPKKFIELNAPIINMSKMSDEEFRKVRNLVELEEFTDGGFIGTVIGIVDDRANSNIYVELTLKCAHCKKVNKYKRIERKRVYSNHFKIPCRHCGARSVYDTRSAMGIRDSEYKYKMYYHILKQIEFNDEDSIKNYFANYESVSILYDDELGDLVINKMRDVCIKNIVDIKHNQRYENISDDYECLSLEEFFSRYTKRAVLNHAIVICDIYNAKGVMDELKRKGYEGDMVSFMDVVMNL